MFDGKLSRKYKIDFWHIVPIVLLLVLAFGITYSFTLYAKQEGQFYRKAFESQAFWAVENVESRVAHMHKEILKEGRGLSKRKFDAQTFTESAGDLLAQYPGLSRVSWLDANRQWVYGVSADGSRKGAVMGSAPANEISRDKTLYFPAGHDISQAIAECLVPISPAQPSGQTQLAGFVQVSVKLNDFLEIMLPNEFNQQNLISVFFDGRLVYSNRSNFSYKAAFNQSVKAQRSVQVCGSEVMAVVVPLIPDKSRILNLSMWMLLGLIGLSIVALCAGMVEKYRRFNALAEIEQQYQIRQAFENSLNVGVRIHKPNGDVIYVNEAFTRMVGYDAEEILHRPVHLLPYLPPEEFDNVDRFTEQSISIAEQMSQGYSENYHRITKFKCKDGRYITTLMRGVSLLDAHGKLTGWVTSVEDVSEKIRVENELKHEFSMRRAIEDTLHVGVRVHNLEGRVIYANPAFYEIVGYGVDEVIGCGFDDAPYLLDKEREKLKNLIDFCIANSEEIILMQASRGYFMPLKFKSKNGSIKDMILRGSAMVDDQGQLTGWITSVEDVTEQKRLEDFKINETKRLETLQYLINLGEMASAISHELNQPLSAISGYAAGLYNYLLNNPKNMDIEKISEVSEKLKKQAERASKVTRRVQQLVKNKELNLEHILIGPLLEQTADLMELELRQKNCELTINGLEHSWSEVYVDTAIVQHAIINIVRNSIDALVDFGTLDRNIDIEVTQQSEYFICLIIKDSGPGVPKEIINDIFEPFFTTKEQGVGIGLNICRTMIESIGGYIWAKSVEEGGGFYITLPILA